jgi:hypothetical protein
VDDLPAIINAGVALTLTATADDLNGSTVPSCQQNGNSVAYTSFEEPSTGARYQDLNTASHALVNIGGLADVIYTSLGGELGFSAYFTSTGGTGLSDGDYMGIQDFTGDVGMYTDGFQGYELSDTDGIVTVTLDTVNLATYANASVCTDIFVIDDSWETDDRIRVWVNNGSTDIDLLNTAGSDIDSATVGGYPLEGAWRTLSLDLSGYTSATLKFELESNASAEAVYFDNIVFTDAAPGPQTPVTNIGTVSQVEFFYSTDGGQTFVSAGTDTDGSDGWTVDFVPPVEGDYQFYSVATDSDGLAEPAPIVADVNAVIEPAANSTQIPLPLWIIVAMTALLGFIGMKNLSSNSRP